ncbi:STAS domain-containing protein [Pseudoalteromonas piscicida]|uniref:STAS domain-containing protein n=1 Tax=Pseudoalteromonas piscicida TaxID=43662 RepID=A0A2A5JP77_PSEO7|nr:STAS domain-containing protein [Pseudoalteromonas piscicida]PCK31139.1 hypothetical protein CEX98_13850 [Pseudoalteromonas piscicida]
MAVDVSQKADFTIIECSDECNIFYVHALYPSFQTVVDAQPSKVIVDLTSVQDIDTAGLQLLLWLKKQLPASSELLITTGDNQPVLDFMSLYQLNTQLSHLVEDKA